MGEERICRSCSMLRQDVPVHDGECRRYRPTLDTGSPLANYNFSFPQVRGHTRCPEYVEADRGRARQLRVGRLQLRRSTFIGNDRDRLWPVVVSSLSCCRPPSPRWTIRLEGRLQLTWPLAMPYVHIPAIMAPEETRVTGVPGVKFTHPPRSTKLK